MLAQVEKAYFGGGLIAEQKAAVIAQPALIHGVLQAPAVEIQGRAQGHPKGRGSAGEEGKGHPPGEGDQDTAHRSQGDTVLQQVAEVLQQGQGPVEGVDARTLQLVVVIR